MSMTVGIDISRDWLDVALYPGRAPGLRFRNDGPGHAALVDWLEGLGEPARIVFEATGAYHRTLALALAAAGLGFCKVNPRRARRFAQAVGRLAKTDRIAQNARFQRDAGMLARMGQVLELEQDRPQGEKQPDLDALSGARRGLVKDRNALLARRGHLAATTSTSRAPTCSSASTRRSSAAPTSCASSPTPKAASVSSGPRRRDP